MTSDKKWRDWIINPKTGYIRDADYQGRTWGEAGNDSAVRIHVIEVDAFIEANAKYEAKCREVEELKNGLIEVFYNWKNAKSDKCNDRCWDLDCLCDGSSQTAGFYERFNKYLKEE
jgi:hypothetical protein